MTFLKVWTSFRETISPLNDAEKGRLFDAMLLYAETGEEPQEFRGNERFLWPTAKQSIDRMALKNETNRENGLKGGRPKNPTKPNETENNPTEPNETLKEKEKEKKRKDIDKETLLTECKEMPRKFIPPTVEEVDGYCKGRNNGVNAQMFVDFYSAKGWRIGKEQMKDWKACVRTWESRDKTPAKTKVLPAQDFAQRDYSGVNEQLMSDLEREVAAFQAGGGA